MLCSLLCTASHLSPTPYCFPNHVQPLLFHLAVTQTTSSSLLTLSPYYNTLFLSFLLNPDFFFFIFHQAARPILPTVYSKLTPFLTSSLYHLLHFHTVTLSLFSSNFHFFSWLLLFQSWLSFTLSFITFPSFLPLPVFIITLLLSTVFSHTLVVFQSLFFITFDNHITVFFYISCFSLAYLFFYFHSLSLFPLNYFLSYLHRLSILPQHSLLFLTSTFTLHLSVLFLQFFWFTFPFSSHI